MRISDLPCTNKALLRCEMELLLIGKGTVANKYDFEVVPAGGRNTGNHGRKPQ